jgi:hypothetical protein
MDCPDRERAQYIGDAINEMEEGYYSLGTGLNDLSAKAVRDICNWQYKFKRNGRTYYAMSNVRPGGNAQEISIQTLGTAHAAFNHYLFAGDKELIVDTYQPLYNYLTNYDLFDSGEYDGLISIRSATAHGFSGMNDWADWGSNIDFLLATNVWWYLSAKSVRQMADVDGVSATDEQIAWLDARLKSVEDNFEKFWDENLNAYTTDWNSNNWKSKSALQNSSHLVDDRFNSLAVVAGLVPEEKYPQMRDVFMGNETAPAYENASIYMEKYVLEALYKMGYSKDGMRRMSKRFMDAVNRWSDSTLPEHFRFSADGTKNHGWSGGGMLAMSRYAAGIEPTSSGYATWRVVPQLGNFRSIETRVPSAIGYIDVNIKRGEATGDMTVSVSSPGKTGEIFIPIADGKKAVQTVGNEAVYIGEQVKYNQNYAVFRITAAGSYAWKTVDKPDPGDQTPTTPTTPTETPATPTETPKQQAPAAAVSLDAAITNAIPNQPYTGKQIKPAMTLREGGKELKVDIDFALTYGANRNIGQGAVTVVGKGDYSGSKTVNFKIIPTRISVSKISIASRKAGIAWGKSPAAQKITKYQLRYRVKGTNKWSYKTVSAKKNAYTVKKLKKGKRYNIQVRAYKTVKGAKYYSEWSKTKTSGKVR